MPPIQYYTKSTNYIQFGLSQRDMYAHVLYIVHSENWQSSGQSYTCVGWIKIPSGSQNRVTNGLVYWFQLYSQAPSQALGH